MTLIFVDIPPKMSMKTSPPIDLPRGREPGGAPRAEGERMSAGECKQHDCNQKTFVHCKNALN